MSRTRRTALRLLAAALIAGATARRSYARQAEPPPGAAPQLTVALAGDLMLGRDIGDAIRRRPDRSPLAGVSELLRAADLAVGNLECALGEQGRPVRKSYTFRGPPEAAALLADAGFDLVSLANNHSLDYGPDGLAETIRLLDAAGIASVGAGADAGAARRAALFEVRGLRVAFLACVRVPVERGGFDTRSWQAAEGAPGLAWGDPELLAADVAAARAAADVVVVLMHAGIEGQATPDRWQRTLAQTAIDAGAALVAGHHPHVLQGVERYGAGVIAYSAGNLVFDGLWGKGVAGGILHATLTAAGVAGLRWTPVILRGGRTTVAEGREAQAALDRIARLSRP